MHFTHSKQPPPISITGVCVNSVCTAMHTWTLFCARLFVFDHHHHHRTLNIGGIRLGNRWTESIVDTLCSISGAGISAHSSRVISYSRLLAQGPVRNNRGRTEGVFRYMYCIVAPHTYGLGRGSVSMVNCRGQDHGQWAAPSYCERHNGFFHSSSLISPHCLRS